jgi:hypothetical protein
MRPLKPFFEKLLQKKLDSQGLAEKLRAVSAGDSLIAPAALAPVAMQYLVVPSVSQGACASSLDV